MANSFYYILFARIEKKYGAVYQRKTILLKDQHFFFDRQEINLLSRSMYTLQRTEYQKTESKNLTSIIIIMMNVLRNYIMMIMAMFWQYQKEKYYE